MPEDAPVTTAILLALTIIDSLVTLSTHHEDKRVAPTTVSQTNTFAICNRPAPVPVRLPIHPH